MISGVAESKTFDTRGDFMDLGIVGK